MTTTSQETFHAWFIEFGTGEPVTATYVPPVTARHVQRQHPGAIVSPVISTLAEATSPEQMPETSTGSVFVKNEQLLPHYLPLLETQNGQEKPSAGQRMSLTNEKPKQYQPSLFKDSRK